MFLGFTRHAGLWRRRLPKRRLWGYAPGDAKWWFGWTTWPQLVQLVGSPRICWSADPLLIMESSAVPYRIQLKIARSHGRRRWPAPSDQRRCPSAGSSASEAWEKDGFVRFNRAFLSRWDFPQGKKSDEQQKNIPCIYTYYMYIYMYTYIYMYRWYPIFRQTHALWNQRNVHSMHKQLDCSVQFLQRSPPWIAASSSTTLSQATVARTRVCTCDSSRVHTRAQIATVQNLTDAFEGLRSSTYQGITRIDRRETSSNLRLPYLLIVLTLSDSQPTKIVVWLGWFKIT